MAPYPHAALLGAHIRVATSTVKARHLFTVPESPLKPFGRRVISPLLTAYIHIFAFCYLVCFLKKIIFHSFCLSACLGVSEYMHRNGSPCGDPRVMSPEVELQAAESHLMWVQQRNSGPLRELYVLLTAYVFFLGIINIQSSSLFFEQFLISIMCLKCIHVVHMLSTLI